MTTRPKVMIAERLEAARLILENSIAEAEIQSLVSEYGYSSAELQKGMALYQETLAADHAQTEAASAQQSSTKVLDEAMAAAHKAYQSLAKVARAIFKSDKPRLVALRLTGTTPKPTHEFIAAAQALFDNAARVPNLSDFGYDSQKLDAQREFIKALEMADNKQEAAKGVAQVATQKRDALLDRLDAWRAQYVKIARVALQDQRQLLEKLGVPARTSPTAAQVAASQKKRAAGDKPLAA